MKIPLKHISDMAKHRPPGYQEDVLSHGLVCGDHLDIPDASYEALCRKYRPTMPPFAEMVGNFTTSMAAWVTAGFPVVSNDTFTDRLETCGKCESWDRSGTFPRCSRCGCTQLKLWLKTERCPASKW